MNKLSGQCLTRHPCGTGPACQHPPFIEYGSVSCVPDARASWSGLHPSLWDLDAIMFHSNVPTVPRDCPRCGVGLVGPSGCSHCRLA